MRRGLAAALALAVVVFAPPARTDDEEPEAKPEKPVEPEAKPEAKAADKAAAKASKPDAKFDLVSRASTEFSVYKDTDGVTVVTPLVGGSVENPISEWQVGGRYLVDIVSAASVDIVSTASRRWHEVRHEGDFDGSVKFGEVGVGATGSVSSEPDYVAWAVGGTLSYDFAQKNVTLLGGYSFGHDTIGRSDTPFDVFSHEVVTHTMNLALTVVVNKDTLASFVVDAIVQDGDTSKPYRYIPMFTTSNAAKIQPGASIDEVNKERMFERPLEQLPTKRDCFAWTARLAKRFTTTTLRVSERLYRDTWGLSATTTDLKPILDLGERVSFWPHGRFHAQAPVGFWQRAYVAKFSPGGWELPKYRTGDRELGPLMGLTGGAGVDFKIGPDSAPADLSLTLQGDVIWTNYLDDLYISSRISGIGVVGLSAVFE